MAYPYPAYNDNDNVQNSDENQSGYDPDLQSVQESYSSYKFQRVLVQREVEVLSRLITVPEPVSASF